MQLSLTIFKFEAFSNIVSVVYQNESKFCRKIFN